MEMDTKEKQLCDDLSIYSKSMPIDECVDLTAKKKLYLERLEESKDETISVLGRLDIAST